MDELTYRIEAEIETNHWWFVTRRKLLSQIIRGLRVPSDAAILDLSTSKKTESYWRPSAFFSIAARFSER